jgi:DNA repair ATPase RecN
MTKKEEDKDKELPIDLVTKRLNWMAEEMDKAKPFSQSYNNLNERHGRLLEAKKILDKEGLWL